MGAFHSTKTSGLNFRQLPVANGTALSKISEKDDNLARYTQIFENFFLEVVLPFNFAPGISWFCGWMVCISKFNSNVWTLLGEISVPFAAESTFSKVLVKWKAPINWWHSYLDVSWVAWVMIYILLVLTIHRTVPLGISEFLVSNQSIPESDDFIIARKEHQNSSFSIKKLLTGVTWDQALFSFRFENYIPAGMTKRKERSGPILAVAVRENVWEPLNWAWSQVMTDVINLGSA